VRAFTYIYIPTCSSVIYAIGDLSLNVAFYFSNFVFIPRHSSILLCILPFVSCTQFVWKIFVLKCYVRKDVSVVFHITVGYTAIGFAVLYMATRYFFFFFLNVLLVYIYHINVPTLNRHRRYYIFSMYPNNSCSHVGCRQVNRHKLFLTIYFILYISNLLKYYTGCFTLLTFAFA